MTEINDNEFMKNLLLSFVSEKDPILSMLKWIIERMAVIEAECKIGLRKGEHSKDRKNNFSGYRTRRFDTRMGTIYMVIPKLRKGGFVPYFITARKRSEQALIKVVQEAYINGISTRKIKRLAKELGIENISSSQVSEINKELDQRIQEFKNRKLDAEYPVLWIDAIYEKIRQSGPVVSCAVLVVCGITNKGTREILAVQPMRDESEDTYTALFDDMKKRGLKKAWLCVSDAHPGLKKAILKSGCIRSWQRCKVHFMRNIMAHISRHRMECVSASLKLIWQQKTYESANKYAQSFIEEFQDEFPKAIDILEAGLEDSLQYYHYPRLDARKISSTNVLERINREIRRRSRVVGVFPNISSYERLLISYLQEYQDEWDSSGMDYISREKIRLQTLELRNSA